MLRLILILYKETKQQFLETTMNWRNIIYTAKKELLG